MMETPFSAEAALAASTHHTTTTVDSNVFPAETNKITPWKGMSRDKYWMVCDGKGNMYGRWLDNTKQLKEYAEWKREGLITDADYERLKNQLLRGLLGE